MQLEQRRDSVPGNCRKDGLIHVRREAKQEIGRLAGGLKTYYYGGHPYTFGPRHLFTGHDHVFKFLNERLPLRPLEHYALTYVESDGQFYSYPVHSDDIPKMPDRTQIQRELAERPDPSTARNFEEYWIYSVGQTLYEKFVKNYSKKMWQLESNTVLSDFKFDGKGVGLQSGTREVRPDYYIAYPEAENGWDDFFEICLRTPGVTLYLNSNVKPQDIDLDKPAVRISGEWHNADLIVSTISPDILFDYQYGELNYMGRDFIKLVLPVEHVIPDPTFFLHYANDEIFTRVVEYKKLTGHQAPTTLLGIEIPSRSNKLYPYLVKEQQDLAALLLQRTRGIKSVTQSDGALLLELDDTSHDFSAIAKTLLDNNFKLCELKEEEVNLETAFMRLTKGIVH
ncbi:MAG: UDP-galactopyranose mutase [Planctomycetes bacterium]|nr:UDP-galactopyranose mutase [Planctomycetota bacterium]